MNFYFNKQCKSLLAFATFLVCTISLSPAFALADDQSKVLPSYVFTPSDDPMLQAQTALSQARAENKYALIVLGSQWCHDSVGLAERFSSDEMQDVLSAQFITRFIDVGYLEDRRDITNLVGYPIYFATPTVLIVNPALNTLMNMDSLQIWQSGDSVELATYIEQFSKFDTKEADLDQVQYSENKHAQASKNQSLVNFEAQQSERLQQAYQALGPLLAASENEKLEKMTGAQQEQFLRLWREVKQFRMKLQADIHRLRNANLDQKALDGQLVQTTQETQSWER